MKDIINDLIAEQAQVDTLVADLTEDQWMLGMPGCEKWNIKDAVIHVAFFDYAANKMMAGGYNDLLEFSPQESGEDEYVRATAFHHLSGDEVLAWWRQERTKMDYNFLQKDPKERIPWAPGLPMSAKSLVSARLMELWAHSVDIYDTLGLDPVVRDRITSTLFLSWAARPNMYNINKLAMPDTPLYLELILPSGAVWAKGEPDAASFIKGSAKDWALVAVRRRNWMDTGLAVQGDAARQYADIVQTYAGRADPAPPAKNPR